MELEQHELQERGIEGLYSIDRDAGFVDMSPISALRTLQMYEWDSARDVGHGEGIAGK